MTNTIEYADRWLSRNPATLADIPRSQPLACPMERLIYDMLAKGFGDAFLRLVPGAEKWASEMDPIALAFAFVPWLAEKGLTDKMAKTIPLEPTWGPMDPMSIHDILSYLDVVAWRRGETPMRKECRFLARQLVETFMGKSDFGPDLIREFLEEKDGDDLTCGAILCAIGGEAHVVWRYSPSFVTDPKTKPPRFADLLDFPIIPVHEACWKNGDPNFNAVALFALSPEKKPADLEQLDWLLDALDRMIAAPNDFAVLDYGDPERRPAGSVIFCPPQNVGKTRRMEAIRAQEHLKSLRDSDIDRAVFLDIVESARSAVSAIIERANPGATHMATETATPAPAP